MKVIPVIREVVASAKSPQGNSPQGKAQEQGLAPTQPDFSDGLPPLSVYVHVPWCIKKCPYCDFNSHAVRGELDEATYLKAIEADIVHYLPMIWGRSIHSVFIGGGTPSLLSPKTIEQFLALLRRLLNLKPQIEITMEANPGALDQERFAAMASSGVNRLSIGVQSFNDRQLKALGRVHTGDEAAQAIAMAQRHIERINLDLMVGLPSQSVDQQRHDLRQALSFGTEHLSLYQLTMEPNTVFAKYPPEELPEEDALEEMLLQCHEITAANGYEHYEVSAYAKANGQSRHNMNYWQFGDYLGLGPGAHGKISGLAGVYRTCHTRSPENWMRQALQYDGSQVSERRELTAADMPFEFMLNALRLRHGVARALFKQRTGFAPWIMQEAIELAIQRELLADDPRYFRATELGWRFLNDLQAIFLEE